MIRPPMPPLTPNTRVPFTIIHEDARFAVVYKPSGVVTEPGLGHAHDSLLNGLCTRWGEQMNALGDARDFGLLHRLDRDTSGLLLVALDAAAYDAMRAQFEARAVRKTYLALVEGRPLQERGSVVLPLAEVRRGDMKVAVIGHRGEGEEAITRYRLLARGSGRSLMQLEPVTGRLHQIRVHMAHLGCPIVHDRVYRVDMPPNTSVPPRGRPLPPLALHAWALAFTHPDGGARSALAPVPEWFTALLKTSQIPVPDAPVQ